MKTLFKFAFAILLTAGIYTSSRAFDAEEEGGTKIHCPSGDKYECKTINSTKVFKGEGEVVVEL